VVIVIREGRLDQNITAVENALVGSGRRFFQHLGKLIKACEVERTDFNGKEILVDRMVTCNPRALKQDVSASADLVKWRGDENNGRLVPCDPPDNVVLAITNKVCGPNIPLLHGIISPPTIRYDGSLLQEPGYDRQSKLLYNPDGVTYPKVSNIPTHEEVVKALALWQDLLGEFPFVDEVDRSVAIATAMTFLSRKSLNLSPAFGITSPDFGTGKTYLVDVFSTAATGSTAAVIQTGDDEEFRKRLETELLQGASAIALDNISLELRSDTLSAMLTSEFIKPRTLGAHYSTELATNLVLTITGIQLKIQADLIRRLLRIRLDAQAESPWKRSFKNDPLKMVRERRGEYVAALLTLRRAYHVSGQTINFGSHCGYEQWSRSIQGTVNWLGLSDPFDSVDLVKDKDPEKAVLTVIMDEWQRVIGWDKVRCSEVISKAITEDIQDDKKGGFVHIRRYPEFFDALMQVAAGQDGSISTKRLGKYLDGLSRVVIGDRRFVEAGSSQGVTKWRLESFERTLPKRTDEELPF
jgi:putative DNA primase/helicase